ncbi:MAG: DUF3800 domain-containing protein [Armatimonadia bacterium]
MTSDGQLVYLDESGDAGFKLGSGSTPALVVSAVIFAGAAEARETAECIHRYRTDVLKRGGHFQFHFTNCCRQWRLGLLKAVKPCPFRVRAIVMPKERIFAESMLRRRGDYFYNFTMKLLLTHTFGDVKDAKLFIDGEAGRESLRRMVAYLRQECNTPQRRVFRDIRFVPKHDHNVLVELADMITGSIARSYKDGKPDRWDYRRELGDKARVWEFGKS